LRISETLREKELFSFFFGEERSIEGFFCSLMSNGYVGESIVEIDYTDRYNASEQ
jgi:hypothetical protein